MCAKGTREQSTKTRSNSTARVTNNAPAFVPRNVPPSQESLRLKREANAAVAQQKQREKVEDEWIRRYEESENPQDSSAKPIPLRGKCTEVIDGDSFKILNGKTSITIRLIAIDAPEEAQPFGAQSKKSLSDLVLGKSLIVYSLGKDEFGRVWGWTFSGKTAINAEQIKRGMAWWYEEFAPTETKLAALQNEARSTHVGLWADKLPVAPWNWRSVRKISMG